MVFCVYLFGCMLQAAYNAIFRRCRRISQFQIHNTQSNHIKSGIHHTATKSQFQIHSQGTSSGLYLPGPSRCPAQAVRNRSDNRRGASRVLCIRWLYQIQIRQVIRSKQSIFIPSMTGISQTGARDAHGGYVNCPLLHQYGRYGQPKKDSL